MSLSMQVEERTFFKRIDWNLVMVIFALNFVGLINLYSATHGISSSGLSRRFVMQLAWMGVSWVFYFAITFVDFKFFYRLAYPLYVLNVIALVAVGYLGHTALGAQRWINFGFFKYQPSETMKIALALVLARVLSKAVKPEGLGLRDLIVPGLLTLIPFALVVKQPDLGTALMLVAIAGSMLLFVRVKKVSLFSRSF